MGRSAASKTRRNHKKDGTRRRYIDAPLVRTVAQRSRPRYVVLSTKEDGTTKGKAIIRGNATLTVPVYATVRRKKVHIGHTRIAFVRQALTTDKADALYRLVSCSWGRYWIRKRDNLRSTRPLFTLGKWCALGHARFGKDTSHLAGEASKSLYYRTMVRLLAPYTAVAEALLRKHCPPAVIARIESLPKEERPFGLFTLVMASKGTTLFHKDKNDLVSVMMVLRKKGKGGYFDIGETDYMFNPRAGDAIVGDASTFIHGNRKFTGAQEDRVIILWIVHSTICKVNGV